MLHPAVGLWSLICGMECAGGPKKVVGHVVGECSAVSWHLLYQLAAAGPHPGPAVLSSSSRAAPRTRFFLIKQKKLLAPHWFLLALHLCPPQAVSAHPSAACPEQVSPPSSSLIWVLNLKQLTCITNSGSLPAWDKSVPASPASRH